VISKKKIIDFLNELGLFIEDKPILTKKKIPSHCHLAQFHGCPTPKKKCTSQQYKKKPGIVTNTN
jgi:hypothetical protein